MYICEEIKKKERIMERKIIFRGKRVVDGKWVYGDLHLQCLKPHIHTQPIDGTIIGLKFNINTDTIGQFTGLYDRNQNAIYEDDILQLTNNGVKLYSVVKWDEELGAWCIMLEGDLKEGSRPLGKWLCDRDYKIEVIGNIFDNKELLNQQ